MLDPDIDRVPIGTPITSHQAALACLREIDSPIVGDVNADPNPGYTIQRLTTKDKDGHVAYDMLSSGERNLVDIAWSLWSEPTIDHHAEITALGGLDRTLRRKVLMVLWYRYMGHDLPIKDLDLAAFRKAFEGGRDSG